MGRLESSAISVPVISKVFSCEKVKHAKSNAKTKLSFFIEID